MWLIFILLLKLICFSSSNEDLNCYFTVFYSNGSRSWCLDEECSNHIDIISLEDRQCRTNYLSLKFSSYLKYSNILSRISFSSFFSFGRPEYERLLQIEFLSSFDNDNPFKIDQLRLLTSSVSNIDTYEFVFNGNISKTNSILFIDREMFISDEQQYIDTLRLIFNCSNSQRVEWELIKSIQSLPDSPCPQQINFSKNKHFINNQNCFNINILTNIIIFVSIIIIIIITLFLWDYHYEYHLKQQSRSNSRTEFVSIIQKF